MKKEKPCKGIGKAKNFKGCGKLTEHRKYGIGLMCGCYPEWLYNTPEGLKVVEKATLKASKPRNDLERAKKAKKDNDSLGWLKKNTTNILHKYIKERDKGKPCISCGEPYNSRHQAGHYKKAELFSLLKYYIPNINGQCVRCNVFLDGNVEAYEISLRKRIGNKEVDKINELAAIENQSTPKKWDREELKEIQNKVKELQKEIKQL